MTPGDNVTTETRPDGTKVETKTEMAEDGTVKETVTETSKDGSTVKETVTETQTDGTVSSAVTETKADGSRTEKKEVRTADDTTLIVEAETKPDGTYTANSVIRTGASGKSGAVEIAESLLRAAAEDDRIDSVVVEITETTVNSSEKKNKNTVVNVEIPSVEGVSIEKVVLTKDSIAAAKDSGKGLKVNVTNGTTGSRADGYVVTIPAKQLAKISDRVEELNITVAVEKVANVADTSKKDDITKLVTKSKGKKAKTCVVEVAENADVKAGMNLKVPVKEKAGNSDNVYVYKYDKKTGKLIEAANSRQKVAEDGTVSIAAAAGTDYVVSAKKLSGKNVETIKDGISVSVSKKTAKTGKKLSVKVSLPDTVSQKAKFGTETATVTYKSNTKVASVSKNGKITTKKTGTAVITTAIKLSSGQKMTKKQKITVK